MRTSAAVPDSLLPVNHCEWGKSKIFLQRWFVEVRLCAPSCSAKKNSREYQTAGGGVIQFFFAFGPVLPVRWRHSPRKHDLAGQVPVLLSCWPGGVAQHFVQRLQQVMHLPQCLSSHSTCMLSCTCTLASWLGRSCQGEHLTVLQQPQHFHAGLHLHTGLLAGQVLFSTAPGTGLCIRGVAMDRPVVFLDMACCNTLE